MYYFLQKVQFSGFPGSVLLNVHRQGLNIVEKGKNRSILKSFHIRDCKSWGYKPNALFTIEAKMESDAEFHTSFEFTTKEGDRICHLLTDYAMAFVKEAEVEQLRCEELGISTASINLEGLSIAASLSAPVPAVSTPKAKMKSKPSKAASAASHKAATKIQALWRGFHLRWEWLKEDAAIIIQMIVRGFLARCLVSDMLEELYANGELELLDDYQ